MKAKNTIVTNYWVEFYSDHLCTLCGNRGIIDTRTTAISRAGVNTGRLNWCICPNGQSMRKSHGGLPSIQMLISMAETVV